MRTCPRFIVLITPISDSTSKLETSINMKHIYSLRKPLWNVIMKLQFRRTFYEVSMNINIQTVYGRKIFHGFKIIKEQRSHQWYKKAEQPNV